MTMAGIAHVLEGDGLLRYVDNPRHRRARLAELTGAGRSALEAIQAAQRPSAGRVGGTVGERDLHRAAETLDRLIAALS